MRRIVEAIYEPHYYDEMMGFRPGRSCHKALKLLNIMIENNDMHYILDADIKGFFDKLDHEWIIKFLESRIKDIKGKHTWGGLYKVPTGKTIAHLWHWN